MKRCRVCGRQFPDSYQYCDQDAEALPSVRRSVIVYMISGLLLLAALAAIAIAGPWWVHQYLSSRISIESARVSFGQGAAAWPPGDGELNLRVRNQGSLTPSLRSLQLECSVSSSRAMLTLDWPSGPIHQLEIPANKETDLTLKVSPRYTDPESILSGLRRGLEKNALVTCSGPADFSLWGIKLSQPLRIEKNVW